MRWPFSRRIKHRRWSLVPNPVLSVLWVNKTIESEIALNKIARKLYWIVSLFFAQTKLSLVSSSWQRGEIKRNRVRKPEETPRKDPTSSHQLRRMIFLRATRHDSIGRWARRHSQRLRLLFMDVLRRRRRNVLALGFLSSDQFLFPPPFKLLLILRSSRVFAEEPFVSSIFFVIRLNQVFSNFFFWYNLLYQTVHSLVSPISVSFSLLFIWPSLNFFFHLAYFSSLYFWIKNSFSVLHYAISANLFP